MRTLHALQPQPPTPFAESLSGLIERVTFHSEDTGFAVLKVKAQGQEMNVTVKMGDYKAVSGILFSHTMEIQIEGIPMTQRMVLEKVEVNATIDDSRFEMPKKPVTPAPAPAAAKH